MKCDIDRTSSIPLYRQIAESLKNDIELHSLSKLPSEPELANQFGVSRMTVRQAITELLSEGLLVRVRGRGTIVQKRRVRRPLNFTEVTSLSDDINSLGENVESRVLEQTESVLNKHLTEKLGLNEGMKVYKLARLRLIDGRPLIYQVSYFPESFASILVHQDIEHNSVLKILKRTRGVTPETAKYIVFAGFADRKTSEVLNLNPGDPVLGIEKISYEANGEWFEVVETRCVANAFELTFEIGRFYPLVQNGNL
ncbi:GntR family transcriptional regulator [Alicyclobacillus dauci]|uniref:GntR family transcriptional regulator n=1 Tax=Alicyclobacillus dauci TaxID=1475485 RepID=A0ABY6Z509_9BACL|nr:GntR family transcriptional regulator [Alicyclobacillus dauci]WAH37954.1 GntR family transcriptional regulator [Alicyclobacillus dauci]